MSRRPPGSAVVFLRAADEIEDPYERTFTDAGYRTRSVPVLRFAFHADAVAAAVASPERYGGLVLTSPRAVEALERAGRGLVAPWCGRDVYVVGPRTAAAARALGLSAHGATAGRASVLAARIADARPAAPLLFLASDRRRDVLPDALQAAGVRLVEVTAYRTEPRTDLTRPDVAADWLCFFSPSGVEAAAEMAAPRTRCAAVGPTTAEALAAVGRPAAAVAERPTPEGLLAAVRAAEDEA